jgi:SAM-dependent methyltransferase
MGFHALIQHELGFRVEACDVSEVARRSAAELFERADADIPLIGTRWEDLGARGPRYDLIFNDEVHQIRPASALSAVLRGFHGALKPGGALVFFFSDRDKPADGVDQAAWEWGHMERERVAWSIRAEGLNVTLSVCAERRSPDAIVEHCVYLIEPDGESPRVEATTLVKNYCWDWDSVLPVLKTAGFGRIDCHRFTNCKGGEYTMNLAFKTSS